MKLENKKLATLNDKPVTLISYVKIGISVDRCVYGRWPSFIVGVAIFNCRLQAIHLIPISSACFLMSVAVAAAVVATSTTKDEKHPNEANVIGTMSNRSFLTLIYSKRHKCLQMRFKKNTQNKHQTLWCFVLSYHLLTNISRTWYWTIQFIYFANFTQNRIILDIFIFGVLISMYRLSSIPLTRIVSILLLRLWRPV